MKSWLKGALIALTLWLIIGIVYFAGNALIQCDLPSFKNGLQPGGFECPGIAKTVIRLIYLVPSFPLVFFHASPILDEVGSTGVALFWSGTALCYILWGSLIGWLISKKLNKESKTFSKFFQGVKTQNSILL